MVWATARWWWRSRRRELVPHLLPRFVAWFLASVQLDAMASLQAASRALLAEGAWASAALFAALATLWIVDEGAFVRRLVLGPANGVLRRQPVAPWVHGPGVMALLFVVALPMVGVGLLAWRDPVGALLWGAAALGPLLLASSRPLLAPVVLVVATAVVALGHGHVWLRPVLLGAVIASSVPALGWLAWHEASPPAPVPRSLPWRPRSPVAGLVARDLLVLWRTERILVWGSLAMAPVAGLLVAAARVNGPWTDWTLAAVATVTMLVVGPSALVAAAGLARRLGPQLDPPRWPVGAFVRALALVLVAAAPITPAWAGAALAGGSALGLGPQLGVLSLMGCIAAGATAFVTHRPSRPDHGLFLWYLAVCLATVHVGGPLATAALTAGGTWLATRALRRRRSRR